MLIIPSGIYLWLQSAEPPSGAAFMFLLNNMLSQELLPSLLLEGWAFSLDSSKTFIRILCAWRAGRPVYVSMCMSVFTCHSPLPILHTLYFPKDNEVFLDVFYFRDDSTSYELRVCNLTCNTEDAYQAKTIWFLILLHRYMHSVNVKLLVKKCWFSFNVWKISSKDILTDFFSFLLIFSTYYLKQCMPETKWSKAAGILKLVNNWE